MTPQFSRLNKKFQITIPSAIRKKLGLNSGDIVHFELRGNEAILRKKTSLDLTFLQALNDQLNEWQSAADDEAYNQL
jgi:antitoxin PrlF